MATRRQLFTQDQTTLLAAVLNRIIPAEGRLPGAGDLGVGAFIEEAAGKEPGMRRLFADGLVSIEIAATRQAGTGFQGQTASSQDAILRSVESQYPAFFAELVRQCYNGYYTSPEVLELIGYSRPDPLNYQPRPFDQSLLEPQRRREPFWRQA